MNKPLPPRATFRSDIIADTSIGEPPFAPSRIEATSLFFDDIRMEVSGRLMMVGHYLRETCFLSPHSKLDRLSVFTRLSWKWCVRPGLVTVRVDLPGQRQELQPVQFVQPQHSADGLDFFVAQSVVNLRFPALRPGDRITAWVIADHVELPSGILHILAAEASGVMAS